MKCVLAGENKRDGEGSRDFSNGKTVGRRNEVELGVQVCGWSRMKAMKK